MGSSSELRDNGSNCSAVVAEVVGNVVVQVSSAQMPADHTSEIFSAKEVLMVLLPLLLLLLLLLLNENVSLHSEGKSSAARTS